MLRTIVISFMILLFASPVTATERWTGEIPEQWRESEHWNNLLSTLMEHQSYYTALAAAHRMLILFDELEVKERAYQTIIYITDQGYPFQTRSLFITGNIEPKIGYRFVNSYNFYKGYVNKKNGLTKWADHYFSKVDRDNFSKYLFYKAVEHYRDNDLYDAIRVLKKILKMKFEPESAAFVKKVSRTLARIYFELEEYQQALDIYYNFLLQTNPVKPTDWIEAAWTFYHLKRYNKALGMLYNLESTTFNEVTYMEKFILRALIYRHLCQSELMEGLLTSFEQKFGRVINGVKTGVPISSFKELDQLSSEQNKFFFQYKFLAKRLKGEYKITAQKLKEGQKTTQLKLLNYLVSTEQKVLKKNARMFEDKSKHELAKYLVLLHENLRFLRYDVVLEKFNPNTIFMETETVAEKREDQAIFSFYWPQKGEYWLDERIHYTGWLKNECERKQ